MAAQKPAGIASKVLAKITPALAEGRVGTKYSCLSFCCSPVIDKSIFPDNSCCKHFFYHDRLEIMHISEVKKKRVVLLKSHPSTCLSFAALLCAARFFAALLGVEGQTLH